MRMGFIHWDPACLARCNSILLSFDSYDVFHISRVFRHIKYPLQEMPPWHCCFHSKGVMDIHISVLFRVHIPHRGAETKHRALSISSEQSEQSAKSKVIRIGYDLDSASAFSVQVCQATLDLHILTNRPKQALTFTSQHHRILILDAPSMNLGECRQAKSRRVPRVRRERQVERRLICCRRRCRSSRSRSCLCDVS